MKTEDNREQIDALAEEFARRCRDGEHPAVAEYVERYPELAEEIEELFPSVAMMEQLRHSENTEREATQQRYAFRGKPLERFGDYQIVREIGRGGMGVVYEAVQSSLGRRVALKLLTAGEFSGAKQMRRFRREAQVAARLHHTNIVPVFGVGEQNGVYFYSMQFIDGVGLNDIARGLRELTGLKAIADDEEVSESALSHATSVMLTAKALCQGEFEQSHGSHSGITAEGFDTMPIATDSSIAEGGLASGGEQASGKPDPDATASHIFQRDLVAGDDPTCDKLPEPASGGQPREEASPTGDHAPLPEVPRGTLGAAYWKSVAKIGIQAAEALSYAHNNGILHRDVKPANLLLEQRGTLWVTDFGLAKLAQHDEITKTGDVVGTLRYMSPEQLEGRADARSDVYGLGLTLYELLTLRPAFGQSNYRDLVKQISESQPTAPRVLNRAIPQDLETVVLKAIAAEPSQRYQSASAMAADLERFLADLPVRARRVSIVERGVRWCRRNKTVATLAGLAAALLVMVAAVASIGYFAESAQREKAEAQRAVAESQRERAEQTVTAAVQAFDEVYRTFVPHRGSETALRVAMDEGDELQVTAVSQETAHLVEIIRRFYDRLSEIGTENKALQTEAALASRRLGDIYWRLGQLENAAVAYSNAIERFKQLDEDTGIDTRGELARAHIELGKVYHSARRDDESHESYRAAIDLVAKPENDKQRFELARAHYHLAVPPQRIWTDRRSRGRGPGRGPSRFSSRFGRSGPPPNPAGPPPRRVIETMMRAASERSDFPDLRRVGRLWMSDKRTAAVKALVKLAAREKRYEGVAKSVETYVRLETERTAARSKAIELLEALVAKAPDSLEYRQLLALCYRDEDEPEMRRKSIGMLQELVDDFPTLPDLKFDLSQTLLALHRDPGPDRRDDYEGEYLDQAIAVGQQLVDTFPSGGVYQMGFAEILAEKGGWLRPGLQDLLRTGWSMSPSTSRPAVTAYRAAIDRYQLVIEASPDMAMLATLKQAATRLELAQTHELTRQNELAASEFISAINDLEKHREEVAGTANASFIASRLPEAYERLANIWRRLGDPEQARALFDRAVAIRAEDNPEQEGSEDGPFRFGRGPFQGPPPPLPIGQE